MQITVVLLKMDGSISSKLDGSSYIVFVTKSGSRKIGTRSLQEYSVVVGIPKGFILGSMLFVQYITLIILHDYIITYLVMVSVIVVLYWASDVWEQVKLASKLDHIDAMQWCR